MADKYRATAESYLGGLTSDISVAVADAIYERVAAALRAAAEEEREACAKWFEAHADDPAWKGHHVAQAVRRRGEVGK